MHYCLDYTKNPYYLNGDFTVYNFEYLQLFIYTCPEYYKYINKEDLILEKCETQEKIDEYFSKGNSLYVRTFNKYFDAKDNNNPFKAQTRIEFPRVNQNTETLMVVYLKKNSFNRF